MRKPIPTKCLRCGTPIRPTAGLIEDWPNTKKHGGRGLCYPCHQKSEDDDTLLDYPRLKRSHQDMIDDLAELREQGLSTRHEIAARMGTSWSTIYQAVYRTGRQDLLIGLPAGGRGGRLIGDTDMTSSETRSVAAPYRGEDPYVFSFRRPETQAARHKRVAS